VWTAGGEPLWTAARSNISTLNEIGVWANVVSGEITPVVTDKTFIETAHTLLPVAPWTEDTWRQWTEAVKNTTGRKGKDLYMPLRLALTGFDHGPEMKFLLPLIGANKTGLRLRGIKA